MAAAQEDLTVITGGPPCLASRLHGRSGRGEAAQTGRLEELACTKRDVTGTIWMPEVRGLRLACNTRQWPGLRRATSSTASTSLQLGRRHLA